jgi:hypothetical protein
MIMALNFKDYMQGLSAEEQKLLGGFAPASAELTMPEIGSQFADGAGPSLGASGDASMGDLGAAGIGAASTLATGLLKAQATTEKSKRDLASQKAGVTATGLNKAFAEQSAGMTGPLSGLIASYRAAIK